MNEKIAFYTRRIREGRLKEMWQQTRWIYQYARHYWVAMVAYTLLGMSSTLIALATSLVSRSEERRVGKECT